MEQTPNYQQQRQALLAAQAAQQYGYGAQQYGPMYGGFQGPMAASGQYQGYGAGQYQAYAAGQHQGYEGWQNSQQAAPAAPSYLDHRQKQLPLWAVIKSRGLAIMSGNRRTHDVRELMTVITNAQRFPGWPDDFNTWCMSDETLYGMEPSGPTYSWLIKTVAYSLAKGGDVESFTRLATSGLIPVSNEDTHWTSGHPAIQTLELFLRNKAWSLLLMIAEVDPEAVHAYECHISDTRLLHVCARSDMPPQQLQALVNLMVQPRPQASCWWLLLDAFTTHPDALTAAYLARDMTSVNKLLPIWRFATSYWPPIQGDEQPPCSLIVWHAAAAGDAAMVQRVIDRMVQGGEISSTACHIDIMYNGATPLMMAVRGGHTSIADVLVAAGADPYTVCRTPQQATPAAIANSAKGGKGRAAGKQKGGRGGGGAAAAPAPASPASWYTTPMQAAAASTNLPLLAALLRTQLKPPAVSEGGPAALPDNEETDIPAQGYGCSVWRRSQDQVGDTPLTAAIRAGRGPCAAALVEAGWSPFEVLRCGQPRALVTPLLLAVQVAAGRTGFEPFFDAVVQSISAEQLMDQVFPAAITSSSDQQLLGRWVCNQGRAMSEKFSGFDQQQAEQLLQQVGSWEVLVTVLQPSMGLSKLLGSDGPLAMQVMQAALRLHDGGRNSNQWELVLLGAVKARCLILVEMLVVFGQVSPYSVCRKVTWEDFSVSAAYSSRFGDASSGSSKQLDGSVWWTTPMHAAVALGQQDMVKVMVAAPGGPPPADLPWGTEKDWKPSKTKKKALAADDGCGDSPLTLAVRGGHGSIAAVLVGKGWDPYKLVQWRPPEGGSIKVQHAILLAVQASNAKKFAGFFDLVVRDFQVLHRLKDLLVLETFSAGVQQQLATWLLSHGSAWQAQQKITGEEAAKLITAYKASPSALQVLLSPPCGLEQALEKRALTRKWVLETILVEGSQQLLDVVLREATWLLADLPEVTRCGPAVPALPLDTFIAWLDAGMRPDMRVVMDQNRVWPLSRAVLYHDTEALGVLLDTDVAAVITAQSVDDGQPDMNLLHAVATAGWGQEKVRTQMVEWVLGKAVQLGCVSVFTTKDRFGKVPHTLVKNSKLSEAIRTAEARARKKAAAAKEAAKQAAAAQAASKKQQQQAGGSGGEEDWEQQAGANGHGDGGSDAAGSGQGGKRKQRPEPQETPVEACKRRVGSMLGMLPEALQRVAAGTAGPLAPSATAGDNAVDAAAAEADSRRAAARQRRKQQAALQQRLADIAPEQLPQKDASLSEGRQAAEAPAAAPAAAADEEVDPEEDEEEAEREAEAAAAAGEGAVAGLMEDDVDSTDVGDTILEGLHWEFTITRDAMASWAALDSKYRRLVALKLRRIGEGCWRTDGDTKKLRTQEPGLELWRTKFTRAGRLVWQVAVDYSSRQHVWVEMVRLWAVKLSHKKYMVTLTDDMDKIEASHRRSQQVRQRLQLRPLGTGNAGLAAAGGAAQVRLPQVYQPLADDEEAQAVLPEVGGGQDGLAQQLARAAGRQRQAQQQERGAGGEGDLVEHLPPANGGEDVFTLLKMYSISPSLMRAMLTGQTEEQVDFPFRVSEAEMRIIELEPRPPASILLLGRSGTGKTTVLVFRLFAAWLSAYQHTHRHQQCVFVTASATLKEQVAKTFRKLQAAAVTNPEDAAAIAAATATDPVTLRGLPPAAFPLFTTTRQWLQLLDASCAEPFFARTADGALLTEGGRVEAADWDGIGLGVDLGGWGSDEEDEEEGGQEEDATPGEGAPQELLEGREGAGQAGPARGQEITYAEFVSPAFWGRITRALGRQSFSREQRAAMRAPLVYQEIMSYIKGSAEALEAGGALSLEQYQQLGAKRAPNFSGELREVVYAAYTAYESIKNAQGGWDRCDLAAHLYQQLVGEGYQGVPLDGVYRDEVQDFTQAELLLDLRVCADPNAMFYCGDTCQTIARGIGFRFEDVKTLLYNEGKRREAAGLTRGIKVGVPGVELLKVNYRTHSGILDPASAVTSCIKELFPRFLDKAPRERAFFAGPKPVLLGALTVEDLSILLSSGDPGASQVEFGAHQVVLVRDMSALEQLPPELTNSNALIMTVGQSKGLEFDDVFIVNFFGDSPCTPEWRVLMTLLDKAREGTMDVPAGVTWTEVAKAAEEAGALRPLDFDERQHSQLCEELKHLYVAITRAKNNLVFFDQDPAKRAPFYHFLRCLGLATYMKSGLGMSDQGAPDAAQGAGTSSGDPGAAGFKSSLSNTPAEWAKRARNLAANSMFHLVVQCYRQAGDAVRAAAYEAVQQLKEVSAAPGTATEARGTSKPSSRKHISQMSKAERQEVLAPIAHQLLACAIQGGLGHAGAAAAAASLLGPASGSSSKPLIEPLDVPGAVAPPLTPAEQTSWLKLAAQVLQKAGWPLEAGRVLLVMGPEHVPAARRVLSTVPKAEAARLYEQMVRAELLGAAAGDNRTTSGSSSTDASNTNAVPGGNIAPLQLQGSFMAAAAALKEAFCLYRDGGEPAECWRLLQEYQPLRDVLPPDDQDRALLAYCNQLGRAGQRDAFLAAAGKLHKKSDREQLLRQHGFWRELASELRDPVEASRLLAAHKDYLAAADRLLAAGVDRLTLGQLQQVHSWLLSLQSVAGAERAMAMWHKVPAKRFEPASQHELVLAECRLHLGRLLLREACGQPVPTLTVDRPVQEAAAGSSSSAQDDKAAAAASSKTSSGTWSQVAAAAAAPSAAASGNKGGSSTAADKALPTTFLQHLPDILAAHPERQEQVDRALQMLAAAAAGFSAADRSPGVVEALSWSLAAKGLGSITTGHHQVAEGDAPDALEAVQAAYRGRQLLQSLLQDLARCIPELRITRWDRIPQPTEGDHWNLTALEKHYGASPLGNNKQQTPVEVRDSNPQLLEALAALDPDVTRFLTPGTAGTHTPSVTYPTACQALSAHLAKHIAGMLQLCLSAAVKQLQRMEWVDAWVQVAAGAALEAAVEQSLRQALRTAVLALALARQMHELQLVLRIVAPTAALLDASISAPYSSLRKHLVLLLVGLEAQPLPLAEWNVAAEFKRAYTQLPLADILPFKNVDGITKEVVASILNTMPKKLLVADPAAGYWQLRSQHLQHNQPEATTGMTLLGRQEALGKHWYHQAGDVYRTDPVHTQLLIPRSTARGTQHVPDAQLLLDGEFEWTQNMAGRAVQQAVKWLQRSLTKEQLAAGLAGSEKDDSFVSVQPLPLDVAVQQVQLALGAVMVGQMVAGGRTSTFLPSWAVTLLHNPAQSPCWADVTVQDVAVAWRSSPPKVHAELAQQVLAVLHQLAAYHWPLLLLQQAARRSSGSGQQQVTSPRSQAVSGNKPLPAMLFAERVPALLGDTSAAVLAASIHTQGGLSPGLQLLGPLASHLVLLLGCAVFTWTTGSGAPQQLPAAAVLVMRRLVDLALAAVHICEQAQQQLGESDGTAAATETTSSSSSSNSSWRVVKPLLQLQEQVGRLIAAAVAAAPPGTAKELEQPNWPLPAAHEGAGWMSRIRGLFSHGSNSSSGDPKPTEQQGIARVKAGAWADVLVQLAGALGGNVVQVMPGSYREVLFQGCSGGRSIELNKLAPIPIRITLDEATLSQVRTMLMPVRREAVQLQKRLSRQELEAARQERIRKQLAAQEAQREAESQLKSSTWFMERCRAAVAAARQRIEARRSAIAAAAAAGAQAAAAAMAGMAGGAAGASAAGSLMGYTNSIIGWLSRVQDALQTCTAGNFLADATCPVCPQQAGSSHSQRQEQQTMAAAAVTVAGALSGLSAGAREFQQHGTKAAHLESYQQYQAFCQQIQDHILPAYAAAARPGDWAGYLLSTAPADMPVQLQRVQLRYSSLTSAAEKLFEEVRALIEARAWGKAASLGLPLQTLGSALLELQQDLLPIMQAYQQQQQQRAQPVSYAAAAAGAAQQQSGMATAASGNLDAAAAAVTTAAGVYDCSHLEQQWAQGAGPTTQEVWVTASAPTSQAAPASPDVAIVAYKGTPPVTAGVVAPSPTEVHMPSLLRMWQTVDSSNAAAAGSAGWGMQSPGTPAPSGQPRAPIYLASPGPSPLDLASAASGSVVGPDTPSVTPGAALGDPGDEEGTNMAMPDATDMMAFLRGMQAADGGNEADAKEAAADAAAEAEETFDLDGFQVVSNRRKKKVKEGAQPYSAAGAAAARGHQRGPQGGAGGAGARSGRGGGGAAAGGGKGRRR